MRCLVLGGTGMLGRAVVAAARARGWAALGLSHAQADLTDRDGLLGWAERFRPEVVVNCAAYTKVDAAETDRGAGLRGQRRRGWPTPPPWREQAGARLVHVSTDYVFDGRARARRTARTRPRRRSRSTARASSRGSARRWPTSAPWWCARAGSSAPAALTSSPPWWG